MSDKSAAIVGFIANLLPLYMGELHGNDWCARSLQDGTLILPIDASDDDDAWVNIHWQGDAMRRTEVLGEWIATLALERYVRLHGVGAGEEAIAAELWFMAEHFRLKTGCHIYLPELSEPPHPLARAAKAAAKMGQGILVNLMTPKL
jgi:hypothetical protein